MSSIHPHIERLPEALAQHVLQDWEKFEEKLTARQLSLSEDAIPTSLPLVWAASDYVAKTCTRWPDMLLDLLKSDDLNHPYPSIESYHKRLHAPAECDDENDFASLLRYHRHREMVRIAWRDIAGLASLEETLAETSWLAESCVRLALRQHHHWLAQTHGQPRRADGSIMEMVVLGMGKLGAFELNYSSDIDLIYCFAEHGQTDGSRPLSHNEFFSKLGQKLTACLNQLTAEGFVFRVDTRLRPFGDVGQLALSFDAMEAYYEQHGREWERYAMIKARPIAGCEEDAGDIMQRLAPFVYRRYLDFGTFEALREMKELITREVKRKGMQDNVKLGAGGIREIEFIGQAFQLIRGGREPRLRERSILAILQTLGELGLMPDYAVNRLTKAYGFLRRVENRLQQFQDQQTHSLPKDAVGQQRLAISLGYRDWRTLALELESHRNFVDAQFQQTFAAPQAEEGKAGDSGHLLRQLWLGRLDENEAASQLAQLQLSDPAHASQLLASLRNCTAVRSLSPRGRARLDTLMPLALGALGNTPEPQTALLRFIRLIESIARRSAYVALLVEHPMALSQLMRLIAISPWIADQLTRFPILLDELLAPGRLYAPVSLQDLRRELATRLQTVAADDVELHMEVLRQFKLTNVLRIAAAQLTGSMELARVSDHLSFIAEAVLEAALEEARHHLGQRHGQPRFELDGEPHQADFCIIAYGKLGGLELGFGSDLDLVFLHDSQGNRQQTDGEKPLDNNVYFARLGQRIIHLLTTPTSSGILYEVDTRLRPSGGAGLLVSSVNSFISYQEREAWTWEHQALVRARPVAGSERIAGQFAEIRQGILCQPRDEEKLRNEVKDMRDKMRKELVHGGADQFDLKQGQGGITDIEFLIQFLLLRHAHDTPELIEYSDNLRQIEALTKANLLTADDATMLTSAYLAYRRRAHELALQQQPALVAADEFEDERQAVAACWRQHLDPQE